MLTVRELIGDVDVKLRSGEAALDLPVRWVHISEPRRSDAVAVGRRGAPHHGEQLDGAKRQREFIARLADHQLAGLGFGIGFTPPNGPQSARRGRRRAGLPALRGAPRPAFIAITEAAFTRLVNEQYAVLRRAIAAHERLERIVLSERGLDAVVTALATLVGGAALVFDARGELLAQRGFRRALDPATSMAFRTRLARRPRRADRRGFEPRSPQTVNRALVLPVAAHRRAVHNCRSAPDAFPPEAWLVAIKDAGRCRSSTAWSCIRRSRSWPSSSCARASPATPSGASQATLPAVVRGELAGRTSGAGWPARAGRTSGGDRGPAPEQRTGLAHTARGRACGSAARREAASALVAMTGSLTCALVAGNARRGAVSLAARIAERDGRLGPRPPGRRREGGGRGRCPAQLP